MYLRSAPIAGGSGGGVDEVTDWSLVTQWGSVNDPGGFLASSSHSAGLLSFTPTGDTSSYDGWQENVPDRDVLLTTLYSDWSDATDRLELCMEIAAMALATNKYGLGLYLRDAASASRATALGTGMLVYPNSATVIQAAQMGPTGAAATAAANGSNTNVAQQLHMSVVWDSGGVPRAIGRIKRTSDQGDIVLAGTAPAAMGSATNRRICCSLVHVSTTAGTPSAVQARVYTRRIRSSGPFV